MPLNILRIQKNASTSLGFLGSILTSDSDLSIVVVREPVERFWSACKTLHPKLTWFRKPFMSDGRWQTPEFSHDYPISEAIEECLNYLIDDPDRHFKPQMSFIGDKKFNFVFKVDEVDVRLHELLQSGVLKIRQLGDDEERALRITFKEYVKNHAHSIPDDLEQFSFNWKEHILNGYHLTVSPKEKNDEALNYIRTCNHYSKIYEYYKKDFQMWDNPDSLLL